MAGRRSGSGEYHPKLIIIHLSCFYRKTNVFDSDQKFRSFLYGMAHTDIQFLVTLEVSTGCECRVATSLGHSLWKPSASRSCRDVYIFYRRKRRPS